MLKHPATCCLFDKTSQVKYKSDFKYHNNCHLIRWPWLFLHADSISGIRLFLNLKVYVLVALPHFLLPILPHEKVFFIHPNYSSTNTSFQGWLQLTQFLSFLPKSEAVSLGEGCNYRPNLQGEGKWSQHMRVSIDNCVNA